MKNVILLITVITFSSFAQQKDSLKVLQNLKEVPEKFKLEHFGIKGNVASFKEFFGMPNDNSEMYYYFDKKGNLLKIEDFRKVIQKEFFYDENGKLKAYKTKKYDTEVELDDDGNILIQHVYKKNKDTVTLVNSYNEKGYWTSQTHLETNQKILEHKYDKNNKMIEIISYNDGKPTTNIKLTYNYFKQFIQICQHTTFLDYNGISRNYFYVDYYGNDLYGFSFEDESPTQQEINEFFAVYKIDKYKNWFKTNLFESGMGSRIFTYY